VPFTIDEDKVLAFWKALRGAAEVVRRPFKKQVKLNDEQCHAAMYGLTSKNGFTVVYGSPGTGKSTTVTASASEQVRVRRKVLFVCPSNKATDAALSTYRKKDKTAVVAHLVGPFTSQAELDSISLERGPKAAAGDATAQDELWKDNFVSNSENATHENRYDLYHVAKRIAFKRWTSPPPHPMQAQAEDFFEQEQKLGKKSGVFQATEELKKLDEMLSVYFLRTEVDIVFTTCSSASHPILAEAFQPALHTSMRLVRQPFWKHA
jgi:hypothetical protein